MLKYYKSTYFKFCIAKFMIKLNAECIEKKIHFSIKVPLEASKKFILKKYSFFNFSENAAKIKNVTIFGNFSIILNINFSK